MDRLMSGEAMVFGSCCKVSRIKHEFYQKKNMWSIIQLLMHAYSSEYKNLAHLFGSGMAILGLPKALQKGRKLFGLLL